MSLYLLVNDVHLSDKPPSSCTDAYAEDLFALLEQVVEKAAGLRAAAVVFAGDVFHHKAPSRTSHRLVQRLQRLLIDAPCPVYIVPGNHDLQNDRFASLYVTQPLGVLLNTPNVELAMGLTDDHIFGVPWQPRWDEEALSEALGGYAPGREGYRQLAVAHAPLYPPGQELPYEYVDSRLWAEAMGGAGQCWYGHVHERHGVWEAGGVAFANFGALSRGSLHEYNLTRKVAVGAWDSVTGLFQEIELDARPAAEVFRLKEKAEVVDMQGRLDEFLAGIGGATLDVLSIESVVAHVKTLGLGKDAEALIEELLS